MSRYLFDEMAIERDIVCLLSIINASEKNHDLLSGYFPEKGIFYTEWTLIQELLIGTAVKLRLIDELFREAGKTISYPISSVGQLISNPGEDKVDLSFREACNKIIHAKDFIPQSKVSKIVDNFEDRVYLPFIKLVGKKGKSNWNAIIDIRKYCACALTLLDIYDMSEVYSRTGEL